MAKFRLTKAARADLGEIARYTLERWGDEQRKRYLRQLDARFRRLARNPTHGIASDEIRPGYWRCSEGRHVIFYRIQDGTLAIIRVLHARMLPERHL